MKDNKQLELNLARKFTSQIVELGAYCPKCAEMHIKQHLCRTGDFEEVLFCPHCKLEIIISAKINRR